MTLHDRVTIASASLATELLRQRFVAEITQGLRQEIYNAMSKFYAGEVKAQCLDDGIDVPEWCDKVLEAAG